MLRVENGKRTQAMVRLVLEKVDKTLDGRIPRLITTDEFKAYKTEILRLYGRRIPVARKGSRGRFPRRRQGKRW